MNRIAGRSGITLFLVLILVGGLVFFLGEYVLQAKTWVSTPGSPHVYNAGNLGCGIVTDRTGTLLLNMMNDCQYSDDLLLRMSTIHWLGDREGNISAPAPSHYAQELAGFDLVNGIYSYAGTGGQAVLTLYAPAQVAALEAMGGYKGTVAVYNYKTGEILCAVSTPTYDPDAVPDIEGGTTGIYEGVYLNRFTQANYVPGSIFKVLTTAAAIETVPGIEDEVFHCDGDYLVDGNQVSCTRAHGEQTLSEALTNSCNCAYAQIGLRLGGGALQEYVEKFALTESLTFDGITTAEGYFDLENATDPEIAWSAIGQHHDAVNPCRFMTFMGAIAGNGSCAQPYLVAEVRSGGSRTYAAETVTTQPIMSEATARKLQSYLRGNVEMGYGDENFPGLQVCAKSGTAELDGEQEDNAMFAGFVQDERYPLAFFVAVEGGGYGSYTCVPIISQVLQVCKEAMDTK